MSKSHEQPEPPLAGCTILVTRPESQSADLTGPLFDLGAKVRVHPAIEILPPQDWLLVDATLSRLDEFDWLVFASINGVQHFFQRCKQTGVDVGAFRNLRLAAVGDRTVTAIREQGFRVGLVPEKFDSSSLARELSRQAQGDRVLLIRADRGSPVLSEGLKDQGISFEVIAVYRNVDVSIADRQIANDLAQGKFDWVSVTSSAIARSLVSLFGDSLRQTKLVAISPTTAGALNDLGFSVAAVADPYNMAGVVQAILDYETGTR